MTTSFQCAVIRYTAYVAILMKSWSGRRQVELVVLTVLVRVRTLYVVFSSNPPARLNLKKRPRRLCVDLSTVWYEYDSRTVPRSFRVRHPATRISVALPLIFAQLLIRINLAIRIRGALFELGQFFRPGSDGHL